MNDYVIVGGILAAPLILALLFRLSAVYLFLGLAAGVLLSKYLADDTSLVIDSFVTGQSKQYVEVGLLLLPVTLNLLFLRKTLNATLLVLHILPLVVTSAALGTLVISALPGGIQHDLINNPAGKIANSAQNVLIAGSVGLTLMLTWFTGAHRKHRKRH